MYTKNYWKRRKIPGPKPNGLFGNSKDYGQRHFISHDNMKEIYNTYPSDPVVGLFSRASPILLVKDLTMIEDILVKNFEKFCNRTSPSDPFLDPMSENLFRVNNPTWKPLRRNLSPFFSTGKLKHTFDKMSKCTDRFIEALNIVAEKNELIELCAFTGKLSTDMLALSLFSIDSNTLMDEYSDFHQIVSPTPSENIAVTPIETIKWIYSQCVRAIKTIFRLYDKSENFFMNIIKNSLKNRKKSGVKMNDFVDILLKLKDRPDQLNRKKISDNLLLAQAMIFTAAANEAVSLTISHALYELALNPGIQDKLRNEIAEVSEEMGGKLDYYSMTNAKYLDKILKETLRKYPPVSILGRNAGSDHTFLNTNISISEGCSIFIPIYAIHHDPMIYPEPEKFDPDRFDVEVSKLRPKMSYLPFGDGPRKCIGNRYAENQMKLCLAVAIANFKFEVCEKTCKVYKPALSNVFIAPDGGITLRVKKI